MKPDKHQKIIDALSELKSWAAAQKKVRLVLGPPVDNKEIDSWPGLIAASTAFLQKVPFQPEQFVIPASYRYFMSLHSFARIEYNTGKDKWKTYEPFNLYGSTELVKSQYFTRGGWELNGREIHTTFLTAFATAGYSVEASRWCFYTDTDIERKVEGELPVLCESNDYECNLAKYVDTGEWIEDACKDPVAYSFEDWFSKLVAILVAKPFSRKREDEIPDGFYASPSAGK
ncbi:hypothetical protein AAG747_03655 [Rapidithrix thailandica]|uniref:Uncharacterized protein n=1 Tax=Rapidithrix thailandica TaxID=413964 RepID=A0AAW9S7S8_9BACT